MQTPFSFLRLGLGCAALTFLSVSTWAQDRRPEGGRSREGGMARMNPLFAALDSNGDGIIDKMELANATSALQTLDRNQDGNLTAEEVRPQFGGPGGPGGPGGRGGRMGPGGRTGPGGPGNPEEMVKRMMAFDKNGDGKLAQDELPERMGAMLERGDKDKDGFLSREELTELAKNMPMGGRPGGERGRDGGGRR